MATPRPPIIPSPSPPNRAPITIIASTTTSSTQNMARTPEGHHPAGFTGWRVPFGGPPNAHRPGRAGVAVEFVDGALRD